MLGVNPSPCIKIFLGCVNVYLRDGSFDDVLSTIKEKLEVIHRIGDPHEKNMELRKLIYALDFVLGITSYIIDGIPVNEEE